MEIDAKMNIGAVNGLSSLRKADTGPRDVAESDSFSGSTALEGALQNTPDIRPEAVASGRALVESGNYPSADAVKKLSNFLAAQLPNIPD